MSPTLLFLAWRVLLLLCAAIVVVAGAGLKTSAPQRCSDGVVAAHAERCPENGDRDAAKLHLRAGEKSRHGPGWGAGLLEQELEVDVLVAGGGSAGTSAAIAAARNGARTVLVEGSAVLGGNGGSDKRVTMVGACGPRAGAGDANAFKMDCREGGIVEEYQLHSAATNPDFVPELFSLEIRTLVEAEQNLTLLLNTWLSSVETAPASSSGASGLHTVTSAICEDQHSQRRYIVKAKVFVDATGDGRLGAEAGAEWIQGREGKAEFNESLAMDVADNETEGTTILYQAEDKGVPRGYSAPAWINKWNHSEFRYRSVSGTVTNGYWWNEVSWPYNTITDGNEVTRTGIANALGIWDYLKNSGEHPESKNMGLTWVGQVGGKREGRRFRGQYVVTQNDIYPDAVAGKHWVPSHAQPSPPKPELFWDRVAYSGWSFDLHNPKGMLDPDHRPFVPTMTPYMFSTPLRALVSKDLTNLFFAGRLASFSHVVYGSQRVMRTCATMGQAAGTAAAYAVRHSLPPIELKDHPEAVWSIQQQLLRDDAFIIGALNEDPRDHARIATITASSEVINLNGTDHTSGDLDGKAVNVISGQSRAVTGVHGVAPGQGLNGTNRWISSTLPATLTLELAASTPVAQVQLVFDTGMHRKLNFNPVGAKHDALHWGPQPETVRDYLIEGKTSSPGAEWAVLCNVTGNYMRRRVHSLPCSVRPSPDPPPPPSPAVAEGALVADLCTGAAGQMWTMDSAGKVVTELGSTEYCLGYNKSVSAFGGSGSAVVALPCDQQPAASLTAWSLHYQTPRNGTGALLQVVKGASCLHPGAMAACNAQKATSITIAGVGDASFNGVYSRSGNKDPDDLVFSKDPKHQLYLYNGQWHLGQQGVSVAYTSTKNGLNGPPVASGWETVGNSVAPPPRSITCQGAGPQPAPANCSCVHAVACAACHSAQYFPGTAVELTDCTADVTHIRWHQLEMSGNTKGAAMLMSEGLCLGLPAAHPVDSTNTGAVARPNDGGIGDTVHRQAASQPLSAVRVTVSATNGVAFAVINEVRIYDEAGTHPFPAQPKYV
jgi:hypothetical protein